MAKKEVNKTNKNDKKEKNKKTFFKSFKTELKKVVWPTPKQLLNNTVTVISIVIICAVIVFVLDAVFETVNKQGIERIRDAVVKTDTTTNNTTEDTNTTVEMSNETTETVENNENEVEAAPEETTTVNGENTVAE